MEKLVELVRQFEAGEIVLPIMQREYVWKAKKVEAPTAAATLEQLQCIRRVKLHYGPGAPPALRALAEDRWIPSTRTAQQKAMLSAVGLAERPELGATLETSPKPRSTRKRAANQ